jgi:hypothetical protein
LRLINTCGLPSVFLIFGPNIVSTFMNIPQENVFSHSVSAIFCCMRLGINLTCPTVRIFFPDCPDVIFPVRNKTNTHSGQRKVRKFYKLRNLKKSHYNCGTCDCTQFFQNRCQPDCKHDHGFVYAASPKSVITCLKRLFSLFYDVIILTL